MSKDSHLLNLPRELRNLIYEFALTSTHGLIYVQSTSISSANKPHLSEHHPSNTSINHSIREYNRLKYASKLLYIETSYLELQYNTIIFLEDPPARPSVANILPRMLHMVTNSGFLLPFIQPFLQPRCPAIFHLQNFLEGLPTSRYRLLRSVCLRPGPITWLAGPYPQGRFINHLEHHLRTISTLAQGQAQNIFTKCPNLQLEYEIPNQMIGPYVHLWLFTRGSAREYYKAQLVLHHLLSSANFLRAWVYGKAVPNTLQRNWGEDMGFEYKQTRPPPVDQNGARMPKLRIMPVRIEEAELRHCLQVVIALDPRLSWVRAEKREKEIVEECMSNYRQWQMNGIEHWAL